ncbi:MAG: hypothetical protein JJ913_15380 [Rhizobiaceae bacterium]|nr:hypothetical protein [Rhizobiaceae bacterium]
MKHLLSALIVAALVSLAAGTHAARAADFVHGVSAADPGACADDRVLARISQRFRHQVRNVPHLPQVEIVGYARLGQKRYLPSDSRHPIERRYCHGSVDLSNGKRHSMWYLIEEPMGFAGVGSNVEFCIAGFDRWLVYGGRCRVLR